MIGRRRCWWPAGNGSRAVACVVAWLVVGVVGGCAGRQSLVGVDGLVEVAGPGSWFEPSVAVDRAKPSVIAVAAMEAPRPVGHVHLFMSGDGGRTWQDRGRVFVSLDAAPVTASGDVTVAFDDQALLVTGLLLVDGRNAVAVARSTDQGRTFAVTVVDHSQAPTRTSGPRPPADRLDKPWMTVSTDERRVTVVWAHQRGGVWELHARSSTDGGRSFSDTIVVDAGGTQPQFGVAVPGPSTTPEQVVWTSDGAQIMTMIPSASARSLSDKATVAGSLNPVVVDGRAGRDACWVTASGAEPSVFCAVIAANGAGSRVARGEGLPSVVSDGATSVLVTVKPGAHDIQINARWRTGGSWSRPSELAKWATPQQVCIASCEPDGGVPGSGDGVPEIGDYHGIDWFTGRQFVLVTVQPAPDGQRHLWLINAHRPN